MMSNGLLAAAASAVLLGAGGPRCVYTIGLPPTSRGRCGEICGDRGGLVAGDGGFRPGNEILATSAASASTSTAIEAEDAAAADGSDDERASPSPSPAARAAAATAAPLDDGPEDDRMHAWS
jgi:hypothetical protein